MTAPTPPWDGASRPRRGRGSWRQGCQVLGKGEGQRDSQVPAGHAAETAFPVTSRCEWRGLERTREDSAILGFERDPAESELLASGPLLLIPPRLEEVIFGCCGSPSSPPSFLSAGTKDPLLIELVGPLVWRSRISEVYLASLLIWEPECVISLPWASRVRRCRLAARGPAWWVQGWGFRWATAPPPPGEGGIVLIRELAPSYLQCL